MGKSSKYFHSEKSANNFASSTKGEVKSNCGRSQNTYKVSYESHGQPQIPVHSNSNYSETHDQLGYTHTSEDI